MLTVDRRRYEHYGVWRVCMINVDLYYSCTIVRNTIRAHGNNQQTGNLAFLSLE